jgi:hypothetical protein
MRSVHGERASIQLALFSSWVTKFPGVLVLFRRGGLAAHWFASGRGRKGFAPMTFKIAAQPRGARGRGSPVISTRGR